MSYSATALGDGLRLRSHRVRSDRPSAPLGRLAFVAIALAGLVGFAASMSRSEVRLVDPRAIVALLPNRLPSVAPLPGGPSVAPSVVREQARDEQRYADALRSIHLQLEQSVARVGLGAAFYKSRDIDRRELQTRLSQELASYRRTEAQVAALQPPPTLRAPHQDYLDAVKLFQQAALEMLRMYEDGDEEHLAAALPLSLDGTQLLRDVSGQVWPESYPPG